MCSYHAHFSEYLILAVAFEFYVGNTSQQWHAMEIPCSQGSADFYVHRFGASPLEKDWFP